MAQVSAVAQVCSHVTGEVTHTKKDIMELLPFFFSVFFFFGLFCHF